MNRHEFYDSLNKYKANSLTHYGTLGQKWGVRKWQNYDGTFNEAGKERYFGSKNQKIGRSMHDYKTGKEVNEMIDIKPDNAKIKTSIETSFNIPDKYKGYEKEITEEVSKMMVTMLRNTAAKDTPKKVNVNIDNDGKIKIDFEYDDQPQKIGNMYDTAFNMRRKMLNGPLDKLGRKQFAEAVKRNRDMVDAKNLSDEEIDEIINNRMPTATSETIISDFNNQSLRLQMEKALNTKFGSQPGKSTWHKPTQQEYDEIAEEMKEYGWDVERFASDPFNSINCTKPIKNEEYKGAKYKVEDLPFTTNNAREVNKIAEDDLKFLNTKGSLNKVIDNFVDYEWKYYQNYAKEYGIKPVSKSEFTKMAKQNISFNNVSLGINNKMTMMFNTDFDEKYNEEDPHNYFKQVYDVFTVDIDSKTGKISDFNIV